MEGNEWKMKLKQLRVKARVKWYDWTQRNSVWRIKRWKKGSLFIRNHWGWNFNDKFIIKIGVKSQGRGIDCYQFGLFNFALCYLIDHDRE